MIKTILYWEVEPGAIAEVGEEIFGQVADRLAQNAASARNMKIVGDREITDSLDGRRQIYVWNVE